MNDTELLALDLFIESVIKVDEDLRSQARDQNCLDELINIAFAGRVITDLDHPKVQMALGKL